VVFALLQVIGAIGEWGIDIFRLSELSNNRPLTVVGYSLFKVDFLFLLLLMLCGFVPEHNVKTFLYKSCMRQDVTFR